MRKYQLLKKDAAVCKELVSYLGLLVILSITERVAGLCDRWQRELRRTGYGRKQLWTNVALAWRYWGHTWSSCHDIRPAAWDFNPRPIKHKPVKLERKLWLPVSRSSFWVVTSWLTIPTESAQVGPVFWNGTQSAFPGPWQSTGLNHSYDLCGGQHKTRNSPVLSDINP